MNIVIDTNVLFSALIRRSRTRRLICEYEGEFLLPGFVFTELEQHRKEIQGKTGLRADDFERLLELLLSKVFVVPDEALLSKREEAVWLSKDIDPDDAVFFACALAYPGSVIWSDDRALKRQQRVQVYNTTEMIRLLEGQP